MSKTDHPFIIIPGPILDRDDLSLAEKVIFGCIHSATMGAAHKCFLSNEELADRTKINVSHVRRVLLSLETAKLIQRRYSKSHHRSKIDVIWRGASVIVDETCDDGGRILAQGGAQESAGGAHFSAGGAQESAGALRSIGQSTTPPLPPETGGGGVLDLIDQAKTAGLVGCSEAKAGDALATYPLDAILQAIAVAKRNDAARWGYVVNVLKRWQADPDSRPKLPKREPPRPYHLPGPGPPPPDPDALPPAEIAANIRAMLGRKAKAAT